MTFTNPGVEPGRAGRGTRPAERYETLTAGVAGLHLPYQLATWPSRLTRRRLQGEEDDLHEPACGARVSWTFELTPTGE